MPKTETRLNIDFSSLLGPLFFMWLLHLLLPVNVHALMYEKENHLRIMMKMQGLHDRVFYVVTYFWQLLVYVAFVAVFAAGGSAIGLTAFTKNSWTVQAVFYFMWGNVMIALGFWIASLFRTSKAAVHSTTVWVIGTGLVASLMVSQFVTRGPEWLAYAMQLVPSFGLYRGLYELGQYAFLASSNHGEGLTWSKLGDEGNGMKWVLGVFALQWAWLMFWAWYNDQATCTDDSEFCPLLQVTKRRTLSVPRGLPFADGEAVDVAAERCDVERFWEQQSLGKKSDELEAVVLMRNLRKVFPGPGRGQKKVAVDRLSLHINQRQCFGLLGPNGAGKTTTIRMMEGFSEPTSGSVMVSGYDTRTDMRSIYSITGVCPQHDLLWGDLTGREHLTFYGRLKNLHGADLEDSIESLLKTLNLWSDGVGDRLVHSYSGGMKRRLSVAISLIGDPLVVYLDEPSTGLDPASRRLLWDVIKEAKLNKAVILTTHSMEEAEALCDRLGIFVHGRLQCIGNPKELTARHGGFLQFSMTTPCSQTQSASEAVYGMCPSARPVYSLGGTQKFELPGGDITLEAVFEHMQAVQKRGHLKVLDWGVSNVTLEEVFIKITREAGVKMTAFTS
ncbi:unnamed protein product [Ostreobium quekettii]|uniref:ABC transporter domain-containing protein n=1 Tax=Ostreobium quekettii TaxID=121088 RepID=A0A8S1J4E5_9CHLO|nr:unnamed protein product [Ostreobium quekettii]|eukprot:evm.model.scf_26.22 EVM.evm.TU.scf_26.22   scf_26:186712-197778(+)